MPERLQRPPGPEPHFLIGNFPLGTHDPLVLLSGWARQFGDIFYYRAGWIRVFFLNHPTLIEDVLVNQHQNFIKDRVLRNSRWFFGEGLLTSEGVQWLRQRRLIQPAFHRERVNAYASTITGYAEEMLATWEDGSELDIHQEMMYLTVRVVGKVLFNVEVGEDTRRIARALNVLMQQGTGGKMVLPAFVRFLPLPAVLQVRRAVRELEQIVYGIIQQRRTQGSRDTGDLLSTLLNARYEDGSRMTDRQLRDEVMTFLLAGHETTALSLSWIWYLLGRNPEVESKLERELGQVLGGRLPQSTDLARLPYTDSVVKEALRLYPPAWGVGRTAARKCEIGGYRVPQGANVVMSQWITHRDPRFYDRPEAFDPDRWTDGRTQGLPRLAYFPFGAGPRLCIGAGFAFMEAALLLATIAQKFRLEPVPGREVIPVPSITLRPKTGVRMILRRRRDETQSAAAS